MVDNLQTGEQMTRAQEQEGAHVMALFRSFDYGTVVIDPELARKAIRSTFKELSEKAKVEMFLSDVDFRDPDSVDTFLKSWEEDKELIKDLHEGTLVPKEIKKRGHEKYPVYLFINPTNLSGFDDYSLGSQEKSDDSIRMLKRITKYGRVHVVITPDLFDNPGTLWPKVHDAYTNSVANPVDTDSKMELARFLYERSGIIELGLQQRVENPYMILTPTKEAIEKQLITE